LNKREKKVEKMARKRKIIRPVPSGKKGENLEKGGGHSNTDYPVSKESCCGGRGWVGQGKGQISCVCQGGEGGNIGSTPKRPFGERSWERKKGVRKEKPEKKWRVSLTGLGTKNTTKRTLTGGVKTKELKKERMGRRIGRLLTGVTCQRARWGRRAKEKGKWKKTNAQGASRE